MVKPIFLTASVWLHEYFTISTKNVHLVRNRKSA